MFVRRHPGVESALTLDDVSPGQEFITYIPCQEVVERGVFTSVPVYGEVDRWTANAKVQQGIHEIIERTVSLYCAGITPDSNGRDWAPAVTVAGGD